MEHTTIKKLRSGDRFVHAESKKPYIKCDHVITLSDGNSTIHTGVGLYDGALTMFRDDEKLTITEITLRDRG